MAIKLLQILRPNSQKKIKHLPISDNISLCSNPHYLIIIKLPDLRVMLKFIGRALVLAFFIFSFPWMSFVIPSPTSNVVEEAFALSNNVNFEILPLLFQDLRNEGMLKMGKKAVFITHEEAMNEYINIVEEYEVGLISTKDSERQRLIPRNSIDFALVSTFSEVSEFIDRTVKVGGIVALQLGEDHPFVGFHKPSNYKTIYLRQFGNSNTVMAMRKTRQIIDDTSTISTNRKLLHATEQTKKLAALKNLEEVLLEPPRSVSKKSRKQLKPPKYLPDLMDDSLENYPRRVFIDAGFQDDKKGENGIEWFAKNYPTRNKDFEMYVIEVVNDENNNSGEEIPQEGMSDWLKKNVNEEDYVVMKAKVEVVEEMLKNKAIKLVDELFLECKPDGKGNCRSLRAYWEFLALYGRLRDEGIAVHQWWA